MRSGNTARRTQDVCQKADVPAKSGEFQKVAQHFIDDLKGPIGSAEIVSEWWIRRFCPTRPIMVWLSKERSFAGPALGGLFGSEFVGACGWFESHHAGNWILK